MSRQKDLAKNTAILTLGKMCTKCVSFLLLPLYTATLETGDYGIFDLITTYISLFLPLVNWQFDQGIFRFLLGCRGEKDKQTELFSTVLIVNVIQVLCYILIYALLQNFLSLEYKIFLLINVITNVFSALLMQFARGLGHNTHYAVASFVSAFSTVILNVIALAVLKTGVIGLFISTVIAQIITIIYLICSEKAWMFFRFSKFSKQTYKEVRNYSVPLIPNNLAWWVVNASDRTIITKILGAAANGIYTVSNKFPNLFIQFYNIFNLSWAETVSLHYNDKDRDEFLSETMTTVFRLFSSACFGIIACVPFVFPIMINSNYYEAYFQIPILMYAMLCRVIVGLYSVVYIAQKNSKKITQTTFVSAIVNPVVHLLLIDKIGLYAASISTLIAFGLVMVIRYYDINKTVHMRINAVNIVAAIGMVILLSITYYINNTFVNIIALVVTCVYAISFNYSFIIAGFKIVKQYLKHLFK